MRDSASFGSKNGRVQELMRGTAALEPHEGRALRTSSERRLAERGNAGWPTRPCASGGSSASRAARPSP